MKTIDLTTTKRTATGNGPARTLRRQGFIPAVLYGPGKEPVSLTVAIKDVEKIMRDGGEWSILNLFIKNGGTEKRLAMIKELQTDPLSQDMLHADFYEIAMDREITVSVPVVTTGDAVGVENGGLLSVVRYELEITCLPGNMPESVEIDVTNLDVGDSVHKEDLNLPEGVQIQEAANFTVVTVVAPTYEAPEAEEVEEGEEGEEAAAEEGEAEEGAGE